MCEENDEIEIDANRTIKRVKFGFENCESINVPSECFKTFAYEECIHEQGNKYRYIKFLDCIIKDSGNMEYNFGFGSLTTPIQRLVQYNDIVHVDIIYEDDSSEEFVTNWFNEYDMNNNDNQVSKLISYKEIHIQIRTKLATYTNKLIEIKKEIKDLHVKEMQIISEMQLLEAV